MRSTVFHSGAVKTISDVKFATAGWVDLYNTRRLHSSIGYLPPIEYETFRYSGLDTEDEPQLEVAQNLG